jgi:hypothetical protein
MGAAGNAGSASSSPRSSPATSPAASPRPAAPASIVAEIVTYGGTALTATGLGAYIAAATETGDFHQILAGVAVMSGRGESRPTD